MKSNVGGKATVKCRFMRGMTVNMELSTKSMLESREIQRNLAKSMYATKVLILYYNPKFIFLMYFGLVPSHLGKGVILVAFLTHWIFGRYFTSS